MTTQNCAECGTRAEPGQSFCDACGAVLTWDQPAGRAARQDPPPLSTSFERGDPPARPGPAGTGLAPSGARSTDTADARTADERADDGHGIRREADGRTPGDTDRPTAHSDTRDSATAAPALPDPYRSSAPDATAPTTPMSPTAVEGPDEAPDAATTVPHPSDTMSERARSLLVPVADPEDRPTAPPAVAPVLPGRPDADRPQVRAPWHQGQDAETGPPCRWCATPNHTGRHYCARCAMPLSGSDEDRPAERRLPWWRRMLDVRNREAPWAGDRPRLRRTFDRIGSWIGGAVVLTLLVLAVVYVPDGIQATRDHFAKRAPIAPNDFRASRSYPGHEPDLTFDKISNTWWGPGVKQSGEGEWIEARFAEPVRPLDVIITSGVSSSTDQLTKSALPHRIEARITMKDGKTKTLDLTLDQAAGGQRRAFDVGEITAVRFTIKSAYGASDSKQVAIAEIEFFARSNADQT
ncbi:zinc ribbon domain-containing protein [Streptomyces sp. NPDC006356]